MERANEARRTTGVVITNCEGHVIVSPDTLGQIRELIGSIIRFGEQDNDLDLRTIFRDEIVLGARSFASKIDGDRDVTTFHRPLDDASRFQRHVIQILLVAIGLLHPVNRGNGDYIRCSDGIAEIAVLHAGITGHGNDPTVASGKNQYHG